jgi:hypothetical protein
VILFRGTSYDLSAGRPGLEHDVGPGLYLTPSRTMGATYADERRQDEHTRPGAPGIVLAVEITERDLGRVLNIYEGTPEAQSWEAHLNRPMFMGMGRALQASYAGGREAYRSFFFGWLREQGISLSAYDAVLAWDYRLQGPQLALRNRAMIDAFLRRSTESARATDAPGSRPHPGTLRRP